MNYRVYIIVLNWNNIHDTIETIDSLNNQDYSNHEIIIVDNNSNLKVKEELKRNFPNIVQIENQMNYGYTGGNNIGIKYALENNADIVIIANNDILIEDKSTISKIVQIFDKFNGKISIIGPKLMDYYNRTLVQEEGTTIFRSESDPYFYNQYMKEDRTLSDTIKYFDGVPGAFMAVKKEVFEMIGFFDDKLFMYGDETDFCYRAWVKKCYSAIDCNILVYHKGSNSSQIVSPNTAYYKTRNLLYLIKKHKLTNKYYRFFLKKYYIGTICEIIRQIITMSKSMEFVLAELRGFTDGIFNNMGQKKGFFNN